MRRLGLTFGASVPFTSQSLACDPFTIIDVLLHCVETLIEFGRRFDIVAVVLPAVH